MITSPTRREEPGAAARSRRDRGARPAAEPSPPWLEWLTRAGYVAKGVLYLLIGGTGILVAVGLAEEARGSSEAVRLIAGLPMGRVLMGALAVGLGGYSLLSFVAALRAPEATSDAGGRLATMLARTADGLAGVVYAGLVALAVRLLADPGADSGAVSELWAARLIRAPGGQTLLGVAGIVAIVAGAYLAYKAARAPLSAQLERRRVSPRVIRLVVRLARLGIAARAVLFALCGWLLLRAAWTGEARGVGGLGDALDALAGAPAGAAAVALVASGCLAYGAYQLAKARYRRLRLSAAARDVRDARDARAGVVGRRSSLR